MSVSIQRPSRRGRLLSTVFASCFALGALSFSACDGDIEDAAEDGAEAVEETLEDAGEAVEELGKED